MSAWRRMKLRTERRIARKMRWHWKMLRQWLASGLTLEDYYTPHQWVQRGAFISIRGRA